jgi:hypothetical protein
MPLMQMSLMQMSLNADAVDECVSVPIRLGLWQKL